MSKAVPINNTVSAPATRMRPNANGPIATERRVVVETAEDDAIQRGADAPLAGLDEAELEVVGSS
jgi:hypothetical protein